MPRVENSSHGQQVNELAVTSVEKCADEDASDDGMLLKVKRLSEDAVVPVMSSPFTSVYDLFSAVKTVIPGNRKAVVRTDLCIAIPEGCSAHISSEFPWKNISIEVDARVIEADFRGPVEVTLFNNCSSDLLVPKGFKVAELILLKTGASPEVVEVECLDETVVDKWCRKSGVKLEPQVKEMLEKTLVDYPEAGADCLKWVLHGWNMRGDKNLVELKNVNKALEELVRSNMSLQNKSEK